MADTNHYAELAAGLEAAAKAARACADEESGEEPTNLRDASKKAKRVLAESRQEREKSPAKEPGE
jgi:hypothetical protein